MKYLKIYLGFITKYIELTSLKMWIDNFPIGYDIPIAYNIYVYFRVLTFIICSFYLCINHFNFEYRASLEIYKWEFNGTQVNIGGKQN